jgi:hypothetical protein
MLFSVPQYIDVEDKVAGPLTARQLLWMIGMGAVLLVLWNIFDRAAFFIASVPVVLVFVAFAFYRPYNQPLIVFVRNAVLFMVRPKVYVWNRSSAPVSRRPAKEVPASAKGAAKVLTPEEVRRLAETVDRRW